MKFLILLSILCLVGEIAGVPRRGNRPSSGSSTDAPATDAPATDAPSTDDSTDSTTDSDYAVTVKALIDSGACAAISSVEDECDTDATSYYETFTYNGKRVIISSGAPNHDAENGTMYVTGGKLNPNRRCTRWQYVVVPENPTKATAYRESGMGSVGWLSSGGVVYNHLSSPDGSLAAYYELDTLDICGGHSSSNAQYHYHLIPYCLGSANDASACQLVGYMLDGFPVYGRCNHVDGQELVSCWNQTGGDGSSFSDFAYDSAAYEAGTCHLDEANGYTFADGSYGYVLTDNIFQTPVGYYGTSDGYACGFTP